MVFICSVSDIVRQDEPHRRALPPKKPRAFDYPIAWFLFIENVQLPICRETGKVPRSTPFFRAQEQEILLLCEGADEMSKAIEVLQAAMQRAMAGR